MVVTSETRPIFLETDESQVVSVFDKVDKQQIFRQ